MRLWIAKDKSRTQSYCLQCRYERDDRIRKSKGLTPRRRNFGSRCRRGHLKTPENWRFHKSLNSHYCNQCHIERRRESKARARAAATAAA